MMKTKTETNVLIAFTFLFWLIAAAGIVAAVWYKAWWLAAIGIMAYIIGFVMSMEIERKLLKFDNILELIKSGRYVSSRSRGRPSDGLLWIIGRMAVMGFTFTFFAFFTKS